ncbi:hypothetical protein QY96_00182 [Bacillus thermotolerans]|uniref:Uncharacterized protein n=1 Tax=Bacillus thermotolerans TaxID=1221996 RepID=A0A0F5I719_BACTR|nr:hypothetical protein QY95_00758 [Bacillus thermotolerans]KKB43990.1 hypothetical protein QY96_00182 [Bacillus thermotolerans]
MRPDHHPSRSHPSEKGFAVLIMYERKPASRQKLVLADGLLRLKKQD